MERVFARSVVCLCLALAPAAAFAQASITGVVKDASGAILPGVTVEAASPALIEKTRSTVTDGSGAYQIIQLVPGTYTVTFTLPGFNTFKREGVELSGSFVAIINAEMKIGDLAETITVTGQTPLVDVRSAGVQQIVSKEVVDAVPTGRLGINLAALQPGIILGAGGGVGQSNTNSLSSQDVGGTAGDTFTDLAIHGGKPAEQRQTQTHHAPREHALHGASYEWPTWGLVSARCYACVGLCAIKLRSNYGAGRSEDRPLRCGPA